MIDGTVVDKYIELSKDGSSPVCLFPTRKACKDFNHHWTKNYTRSCVLMKLTKSHHLRSGPKRLKNN